MTEKEVNFTFRLSDKAKADFKKACKGNDLSPSQVLRKFVREYADKHLKNQPDKA